MVLGFFFFPFFVVTSETLRSHFELLAFCVYNQWRNPHAPLDLANRMGYGCRKWTAIVNTGDAPFQNYPGPPLNFTREPLPFLGDIFIATQQAFALTASSSYCFRLFQRDRAKGKRRINLLAARQLLEASLTLGNLRLQCRLRFFEFRPLLLRSQHQKHSSVGKKKTK